MLFGMSAAQIEAGPVEITVKDLGIVDMVIAQQAQDQGVAPEIMRVRFVEMIRAVSQASPELETIGAALARLVQNRGAALTVQLTPKARVNLMQAFEIAGPTRWRFCPSSRSMRGPTARTISRHSGRHTSCDHESIIKYKLT